MPIYQKIQQVMQKVRGVEKDSVNQHARYKYAGHEAVTDALRDHFAEIGIVRQASASNFQILDGGTIEMVVHVSYVDTEDMSRIDLDMPAVQPSQTTKGTITAQQIGQALSYAVKNVEFKLFALTGDPEPDADSLPPDRGERQPPPNWEHGKTAQPPARQTAQQAAHEQAAAIEDVMVILDKDTGEQEGAATATEAAKMLAVRLKSAGYFQGTRMLEWNLNWIGGLPSDWQKRLEAIVTAQQEAEAGAAKQAMGGGKR